VPLTTSDPRSEKTPFPLSTQIASASSLLAVVTVLVHLDRSLNLEGHKVTSLAVKIPDSVQ
jgi:hypothetical protein